MNKTARLEIINEIKGELLMKKIRIAIITKDLIINGVSSVIMNYSKRINNNFEITIFAGNPIAEVHRSTCEEHKIKIVETPRKRNFLRYLIFMKKALKKNKYDIVHIHCNSATSALELLIAFINGIKIRVTHCHNTTCEHKIIHYLLKPLMLKLATNRFACGNDAGKWLYGKKKFIVINNSFNTEEYKMNIANRKEIRKELGISDDEILIGHVGRFNDQKNHPFIIEVFNTLMDIKSNYKLLLVGTGPNFEEIKSIINKNKYRNNIILYGETTEVDKLYDAMDIFFLPSKYEGLVVVLLEAQIKGLQCIVSTKVSEEGIISKNNVKRIDLEKSPEQWAEEIIKITLNSTSERESFIDRNKTEVNRYDYDNDRSNHRTGERRYFRYILPG